MARILLTGVSGQVGSALLPLLQAFGDVVAPLRHELDLSDAENVRRAIRNVQPQWIINPGAYTAVDKAEREPEIAYAVNRDAVRVMGEEAAAMGAVVISFSTDYVFPGNGTRPWVETDETGPLGVYGASKLAGEQALAATDAAYVLFRTSWVYGATGNNFLKTILRLAGEKEELKIVADQHGAPTWSGSLATLTVHVMRQLEAASKGRPLVEAARAIRGVYHACDAGDTTWFGFASEFLRLAQLKEPGLSYARLLPIPSSEYPTPAKRPLNSRLSCEKLRTQSGFTMPEWKVSLEKVMAQLG